jgi:uncharacterized ferritin-like protein (DUF455 family)
MKPNSEPEFDESLFAPGPARDDRFKVVNRWNECAYFPEGDPQKRVEFLHRQMNEEINGMENAALSLVDFPDADWNIRMSIARQCADEARHVIAFKRTFENRGGRVGEYPVMNFQYRIITNIHTLPGRLAVQNRQFEAEGVDAVEPEIASCRKSGDTELADLFDAQLADEICHVRFANDYISRIAKETPRSVMDVGRAMDYARKPFLQVMGQEVIDGVKYSTNQKGRLEAGFKPEEVQFAAAHRAAKQNQ